MCPHSPGPWGALLYPGYGTSHFSAFSNVKAARRQKRAPPKSQTASLLGGASWDSPYTPMWILSWEVTCPEMLKRRQPAIPAVCLCPPVPAPAWPRPHPEPTW